MHFAFCSLQCDEIRSMMGIINISIDGADIEETEVDNLELTPSHHLH